MADMSVAGDEDQWMLLERQSSEGLPLLVRSRVNNSEITSFEDKNRVSAVILDLRPEYVTDDGFPRNLDDVHRLEDEIVDGAARLSSTCFHTASVTGDARRVMYIAHTKSINLESLVKSFEIDFGELQLFEDFEIDVYREFASPTALDKQLDGDRGVISALDENGDVGTEKRKIDFWFYGDRIALEGLLSDLKELDLELDHWLDNAVGFVANASAPATLAHFRQLTPVLVELAGKHGIEYDGWETFIVKNNDVVSIEANQPKSKSFFKKLFGQKN
jgi:Regulator of ribonuclease activity B